MYTPHKYPNQKQPIATLTCKAEDNHAFSNQFDKLLHATAVTCRCSRAEREHMRCYSRKKIDTLLSIKYKHIKNVDAFTKWDAAYTSCFSF